MSEGLKNLDGLFKYCEGIQYGTNPIPGNIPLIKEISIQDVKVIIALLAWWEQEQS